MQAQPGNVTKPNLSKDEQAFRTNNFDILRIFAATQVLIGHAFSHFNLPGNKWLDVLHQFPGVPMFFVMSGFLISASFEKSHSTKIYFQNRFLRILPGLWTVILVTAVVVICLGFKFFPTGLIWLPAQFLGLIYTPAFLKPFGFHSYNGSLWTIPVELQFYFVLPVVYYIKKKFYNKDNIFILAFVLFFFVSFLILNTFHTFSLAEGTTESTLAKIFRYTFLQHVFLFFLGVICYRYKLYQHKLFRGKGLIWVAFYLAYRYTIPVNAFSEVIARCTLGLATISLAYTLPTLAHKIIKEDISYGVYIYHGLILNLFVQYNLTGKPLYVWLVLIITYVVGWLSWRLVEKPFIKKKKRTLKAEE